MYNIHYQCQTMHLTFGVNPSFVLNKSLDNSSIVLCKNGIAAGYEDEYIVLPKIMGDKVIAEPLEEVEHATWEDVIKYHCRHLLMFDETCLTLGCVQPS